MKSKEEKEYHKLCHKYYDENQKQRDIVVVVINFILLVVNPTLLVSAVLILIFIDSYVCIKACDLSIDSKYSLASKLFKLNDILITLSILLTCVSLILIGL